MQKLTSSLNAIYISTILLSSLFVYGMENENKYEQLSLQAEQYNNNDCFFINLLSEILPCIQPAKKTIQFLMQLSVTCIQFNKLLTYEEIGQRCKGLYFRG